MNKHSPAVLACLAGALTLTAAGLSLAHAGEPTPTKPTQTEPTPTKETGMKETREKPIGLGEAMPNISLRNEKGELVSLKDALAGGPVVLTFYRGTWCPYCVKALESIEQSVAEINELGASVLAVSPQVPENAVDLREQTGLSYELLVDTDNRLAQRLGLVFTLDAETVELYKKYGIDVGKANGTDEWQLPVPATYVIGTDGIIKYAWTDPDYRKRAPVAKILGTLRELRGG